VLLAPSPPVTEPRRRQPWLLPAAAVAGFMVVAGVLVVTRLSQPGATPSELVAAAPVAALRAASVPGARMVRDVRLDEFMRLHQFAGGGIGVGTPGSNLRRVDITVAAEPAR
jgi:sigma-E factor negative regulatory protein RseA